MRRLRIAIVGFGRLGRACAEALRDVADLELAGVVRRQGSAATLPAPFHEVRVVHHVSELENLHATLACVPTPVVLGVVQQILQQRISVVECARLEGDALAHHHHALDSYARNHKATVVVGAGWEPGALPLITRVFEMLIPAGRTAIADRPGVSLHHTEVAEGIAGVKGALATEYRGTDGRLIHYVYVELAQDADIERIRASIEAEPAFIGEEVTVLPVESIAALEETGRGVVIERRGTATAGPHPTLLLEARFDVYSFAARTMVDAVRLLPRIRAGAFPYMFSF